MSSMNYYPCLRTLLLVGFAAAFAQAQPPEPPRPPLDEDPRGAHLALVCNPDATPGRFCSQFSLGINA